MKKIANKSILRVKPYVPGKPIEEVKRELGLNGVIKLASNENPFSPSPRVLSAIKKAAGNLNRYPDGSCYYLRRELARRLKVPENQLVFGNGSDEIIVLAVRAFVGPGDEVIVARPSFLIYGIASKIAGAVIKEVALKDFRYDLEAMKKKVSKRTKIIFIGNPDNPCGTYVTKNELTKFLKGLRRDILVFIDEAYYEYVTERDYPDGISLLRRYGNLIVTRTFSKMYGLAGLRVGYGVARPEIIDLLDRVREPFNVNSIAQAAAVECLKNQSYYRRLARQFNRQKEFLYENFGKMGLAFRKSSTNFILIDVKKSSALIARKLMKKGIIVRDMRFWGLRTYIRVTIGTAKENQKLIRVLRSLDL